MRHSRLRHTLRSRRPPLLGLLTFGILTTGCQIGPSALKVSSLQYSDAVRIAQSEQLLINIVRLHYRDAPVFLGVSSISTQFELSQTDDMTGNIVETSGTTRHGFNSSHWRTTWGTSCGGSGAGFAMEFRIPA